MTLDASMDGQSRVISFFVLLVNIKSGATDKNGCLLRGTRLFWLAAAAVIVVAATAAAHVVGGAATAHAVAVAVAAAAEEQDQDDDPPAVIPTETVTTHKNTSEI